MPSPLVAPRPVVVEPSGPVGIPVLLSRPPEGWPPRVWLVTGGSQAVTAGQRRRQWRSLGLSLALQLLLVVAMAGALAIGPRVITLPQVTPADPALDVVLLAPPPLARRAPVVPVRRPRRRLLAPTFRRLPWSAAPAPPRQRVPGALRAPAAPGVALSQPAPALPRPDPPPLRPAPRARVELGEFGAPHGLLPAPGAAVTAPEVGKFASSPDPPPPQAASGAVRSSGFGSAATEAAAGSAGTVAAAGFGAMNAGGPGVASAGTVELNQFKTSQPAAAVAAPVAPATPVLVPPQVLSWPTPAYTAAAAQHHLQGEVVLQAELLASGAVRVLRVVHGLAYGLNEAAIQAAQKLKFRPARRQGAPVDWTVILHIRFRLAN
ncbi:MAG: TonB family protein [Terriglobales bacterium]